MTSPLINEVFGDVNCLITGGTDGIGFHCANELLRRGIKKLVVLDITVNKDSCRRLVNEFGKARVTFIKCDVSNPEEFETEFKTAVKKMDKLDLVINNAGILDDRNWEKELLLNVNGTIRGTLLGLKYMSKAEGGNGGTIINISSLDGLVPSAGCPIYTGASYAIIGFTKAFSLPYHYTKTGVRMLTICPGNTYTSIISGGSTKMLNEEMGKQWLKQLSSNSTQKPENVAQSTIYAFMNGKNGSIWVSDGGQQGYTVQLPQLQEMQKLK